MAPRIVSTDVHNVLNRLNRFRGVPTAAVEQQEDGTFRWNVGTWTFSNGCVQEIMTETGAVRVVYRGTCRELYFQLHAFMDGWLSRGL